MLKVLMITPQWLSTKGGPTNYVKNLKINMEELGHEVFIVTCDNYPDGSYFFEDNLIKREIAIVKLLKKIKPDIVHIHGCIHYILPLIIFEKIYKKNFKTVFTFHTQPCWMDYFNINKKIKASYTGIRAKIQQYFLTYCNEIATVSKSLITNINEHTALRIRQYTVIHSGAKYYLPNSAVLDEFKKNNQLIDAGPILSTIGVFSWDWKVFGHKIAIEAVNILKDMYPQIRLLIAGDGRYRRYLEDIVVQLKLQNHIVFCGNLNDPSVVLDVADIYVHMGLNEGCPLAVIEAMMAKKIIVAAERGGIPEIIRNNYNGILIEPTAENLANKLRGLLQNQDQNKDIARNAFSYATLNHSWRRITENYVELYTKECSLSN